MNEQVTLHEQSWDRIVELLREEAADGNPAPEALANNIEMQRGSADESTEVTGMDTALSD